MAKRKQFADVHTLESFVDKYGVAGMLTAIAEICNEKAQHVRENWQDRALAKTWDSDATKIYAVAGKVQN